ncbi:hypothetical protein HAX54_043462, partial [Datura stramonium]|nr:hypothetical protein [Datura stramonium]
TSSDDLEEARKSIPLILANFLIKDFSSTTIVENTFHLESVSFHLDLISTSLSLMLNLSTIDHGLMFHL